MLGCVVSDWERVSNPHESNGRGRLWWAWGRVVGQVVMRDGVGGVGWSEREEGEMLQDLKST